MTETISPVRWAAARQLREGEASTDSLVAASMGVHSTTVSHKALEEGWDSVDYRFARVRTAQRGVVELARRLKAGEDPAVDEAATAALEPELPEVPGGTPQERIARIGEMLTRRTEAMLMQAEAGRPLDARQISALASMVQLSERIGELARAEAVKAEAKSIEELAEIHRKIDDRIIYVAECETRRLLVEVFGISQEEVDSKLPEPVEGA